MYYAIRHAKTGNYLPVSLKRSTTWEGEDDKNSPPKLFKNLQAAKAWRTSWRKGRVVLNYDNPDGTNYYYQPVTHRNKHLIEIVPVHLYFADEV